MRRNGRDAPVSDLRVLAPEREVRPQKLPCVAVGIYRAGASRVFAFALRNQGLRRALRTNPPLHKDAECTPAASTASRGSKRPAKAGGLLLRRRAARFRQ